MLYSLSSYKKHSHFLSKHIYANYKSNSPPTNFVNRVTRHRMFLKHPMSWLNLWRMKQFYETYKDEPKLAPLVREIPWSLSPTLVADYQTQLPDKKLLKQKWEEILNALDVERDD